MVLLRTFAVALAALVPVSGAGAAPAPASGPEGGDDPLKVVATIPDLGDLVTRIGGDRVEVTTIAKGTENVHAVVLKPSHLVAVNRADVFLEVGLALEHAFVPGLIERGRNQRILPGSPGFVNVSQGWEPINVPETVDRSQAVDIHLMGNPHINLDPAAGRHMARRILDGLVAVDPESADGYRARHAAYLEELAKAEERWAERAKAFRGRKVVLYHNDFNYFALRYGMEIVDTIEPKPGLPPKPRDLAETIGLIREEGVELILTAKWSNNKNTRFVAEKSGARVLEIPVMVNGVAGADSWIGMMDYLHDELARIFAPDEEGGGEGGGG